MAQTLAALHAGKVAAEALPEELRLLVGLSQAAVAQAAAAAPTVAADHTGQLLQQHLRTPFKEGLARHPGRLFLSLLAVRAEVEVEVKTVLYGRLEDLCRAFVSLLAMRPVVILAALAR